MPIVFSLPKPQAAWNLDNAVYDGITYATGITGTPSTYGMDVSPDGTRMYVTDDNANGIRQYNLSTGWDLTTASAGGFRSVSAQSGNLRGVGFKSDGTKMYMGSNGTIFQYTLSTPWELSSVTYDSVALSVGAHINDVRCIRFSADGTKIYGVNTTNVISQYSLPTPWVLTGGTYVSSWSAGDTLGFDFKTDGTKIYKVGGGGDTLSQYTLSTPWDITTASYDGQGKATSPENGPTGVKFRPNGLKYFIYGFSSKIFRSFTIS